MAGELGLDAGAGAHEARADGGDADAFVAEFGVEALGEAGEGEFAGDVGQEVGDGDLSADRGDVDDGGFAAVDFALLEHAGEGGANGVEGGVKVGVHGALEGDERLVFDGSDLDDAGVVDEDIEAAEVGEGLVDEVAGLRRIGEVGADEQDVLGGLDGAGIEEGLAGAGELILVAGGEDEAIAGATEAVGESEAETAGAAGDDDGLARTGGARDEEPGGGRDGDAGENLRCGEGASGFLHGVI